MCFPRMSEQFSLRADVYSEKNTSSPKYNSHFVYNSSIHNLITFRTEQTRTPMMTKSGLWVGIGADNSTSMRTFFMVLALTKNWPGGCNGFMSDILRTLGPDAFLANLVLDLQYDPPPTLTWLPVLLNWATPLWLPVLCTPLWPSAGSRSRNFIQHHEFSHPESDLSTRSGKGHRNRGPQYQRTPTDLR